MSRSRTVSLVALTVTLIISIVAGLLILICIITPYRNESPRRRNESYSRLIIEKISVPDGNVTLGQVFNFDFDRAYVFQDNYIGGSEFAKIYNLDLSIEQVPPTETDWTRRIVFVDANGGFLFDFTYNATILNAKNGGMVVFPSTKIAQCPSPIEGSIGFEFLDVKDSDYY